MCTDYPPTQEGWLGTDHPPTQGGGLGTDHPPTQGCWLGTDHPPTQGGWLGTDHPPTQGGWLGTDQPPTQGGWLGTEHPPTQEGWLVECDCHTLAFSICFSFFCTSLCHTCHSMCAQGIRRGRGGTSCPKKWLTSQAQVCMRGVD